MPVDIASHPRYGTEVAKYQAAKGQATAAGDQNALAQADANWTVARAEMQMELVDRQQAELGQRTRMAEIKAANPLVPDNVLEGITDLDQAERIAKTFQEIAASRPQQGAGQQWSPPPGGAGAASSEPSWESITDPQERADAREAARVKRMDELAPVVMKKGALAREENDELQRLSLQNLTDRFQGGR
jgi:hypothetical protein